MELQDSVLSDPKQEKDGEIVTSETSLYTTLVYIVVVSYAPVRMLASVAIVFIFAFYFSSIIAYVSSLVFALQILLPLLFAMVSFFEFSAVFSRRTSMSRSFMCMLFSTLNIIFSCYLIVFMVHCIAAECVNGVCRCGFHDTWSTGPWQLTSLAALDIVILAFEVLGAVINGLAIFSAIYEQVRMAIAVYKSPQRKSILLNGIVSGDLMMRAWYIQSGIGSLWFWAQMVLYLFSISPESHLDVSDLVHGAFLLFSLFTFAYSAPPGLLTDSVLTTVKSLVLNELLFSIGKLIFPVASFSLSAYLYAFDFAHLLKYYRIFFKTAGSIEQLDPFFVDEAISMKYSPNMYYMFLTFFILTFGYFASSVVLFTGLTAVGLFRERISELILNLLAKKLDISLEEQQKLLKNGTELRETELRQTAESMSVFQKKLLYVLDYTAINDVMYLPALYCIDTLSTYLICMYSGQVLVNFAIIVPYVYYSLSLNVIDEHMEITFIPMVAVLLIIIISIYAINGVLLKSPKDIFLICIPASVVVFVFMVLSMELRVMACVLTTPPFEQTSCRWDMFLTYDRTSEEAVYLMVPYDAMLTAAILFFMSTNGLFLTMLVPIAGLILIMYMQARSDGPDSKLKLAVTRRVGSVFGGGAESPRVDYTILHNTNTSPEDGIQNIVDFPEVEVAEDGGEEKLEKL